MSTPSWLGHELGGRYVIEAMVGEGGMSTVYRATQTNLGRDVAVKLIHPHLSDDPEFVSRFEAEAAAVAQLSHPNIVRVFDYDHDGDTYFMVLEFIVGETLQGRLRRLNRTDQRMPIPQVVDIVDSLCDAVEYAHKRNMVHRDIKPANVMLNVDSTPILMDFGSVKMLGEKHRTATGAVIGTVLYMSPEQVRGERPDERADIYSMGVTLFEMVSGEPPFEADSAMATMRMHLTDPVPDINDLNPNTPPDLKAIIEKALAKDPADRFQSAGEMGAAMRKVGDRLASGGQQATMLDAPPQGEAYGATLLEPPPEETLPRGTFLEVPSKAQQPGVRISQPSDQTTPSMQRARPAPQPAPRPTPRPKPRRAPRRPRKRRGMSGLLLAGIAIGGLLLVGAVVAVLVLPLGDVFGDVFQTGAPLPPTPIRETPLPSGVTEVPPANGDASPGQPDVAAPFGGLVGRIAFTRNVGGGDPSANEIFVLSMPDGAITQLTSNAVADWIPSWSPDGSQLAFTSFQGGGYDIWVMGADGSNPAQRIALPAWDDYPSWSPDGAQIAFSTTDFTSGVGNSEIFVGSGTGNVTRVTFNQGRDEWPSWSPDGAWLADSSDRDGDLDIYVFRTDGSEIEQFTDDPTQEESPKWSPDGAWIAYVQKEQDNSGYGNIVLRRRDGSETRQLTTDGLATLPVWSPDGTHVAFVHYTEANGEDASDLWAIPAEGGEPILLVEGIESDWAPDWTD